MRFFKNISVLLPDVYILRIAIFLAFIAPFGYDNNIVREEII